MNPHENTLDGSDGPAQTFAQLAMDLQAQTSVTETVQAVLRFALEAIGCDHANLVLAGRGGHLEVIAATDPVSRQGVALQLETGHGPCLAAVDGPVTIMVTDTATEDRWPVWATRMAGLGLRSVLSIPIQIGPVTIGALNLGADKPYAFEADDHIAAHLLASHAAVAVAHAHQTATLTQAVEARTAIGQAQGILMERFSIDTDQAFAILRRYSQDHNTKLHDIAADLITTRKLPD